MPRHLEMGRSVSQLLFSYLPDRTVSWEDGAGVVTLGTPRLDAAWPHSAAAFVLEEIGQYLSRWRQRSGVVDSRFPATTQTERFTLGTPRGITASLLQTAFYCRDCFRFLPRLRSGPNRYLCPDCRRQTLRQVSYVFVHGCGELLPIKDRVPYESKQERGAVYWAPIRCSTCADGGVLRMDARSERLSALRVYCARCKAEVIRRPLARCPYCLPRLQGQAGDGVGQLAFRTAMRITRHSANNAYYPHLITVLRLDRPRTIHSSADLDWLQGLLPASERAPTAGLAGALTELATRLRAAEEDGDEESVRRIRQQIADFALSPTSPQEQRNDAESVPALPLDVVQGVRESIALLGAVRRSEVTELPDLDSGRAQEIRRLLPRLGINKIEVVEDLPVITAVFGYSRRSPDPDYVEEGAAQPFPTTLRPFPVLDDEAARMLGRPQVAGTVPVLAREGRHEGLAIYLSPEAVLSWLDLAGVALPRVDATTGLVSLLQRLEPVDKYYDDVWELAVRRLVFGLLHSVSHCAMKAFGRIAGVEETSVSEYLFLPLLCTVVYATTGMPLGGARSTARDHMIEFLDSIQEEAMRCIYDPDCLQRSGACHGCIHLPEIGCRVFNHGLSRSFLIGGHAPWAPSANRAEVPAFWSLTARG